MNTAILAAAALMALVSFAIHTFVGGPYATKPLLAATGLPKATIWLNYFTWHIVTLFLLIMSVVLAGGAAGAVHHDAIVLVGVTAAMISMLSVAVTFKARIRPWQFPASYLLGTTALLTFWGASGIVGS